MSNNSYYGGFWIRYLANLIDGAIFTIIGLLFYFIFWKNLPIESYLSIFSLRGIFDLIYLSLQGLILYWLIYFLYDILLNVNLGGTLGKIAVGIEIRQEQNPEERITFAQAIGRFFIKNTVSTWFFLLGFIWAGFDEKKQAWHDHLAKTLVIYPEHTPAFSRPIPDPVPIQKPAPKKVGELLLLSGRDRGRTWDVRMPETLIGSSGECDVVLDNDNHYISRKHCEIFTVSGDGVYLRHLSATNPTLINKQRVTKERTRLKDKDVITICDFTLELRLYDIRKNY